MFAQTVYPTNLQSEVINYQPIYFKYDLLFLVGLPYPLVHVLLLKCVLPTACTTIAVYEVTVLSLFFSPSLKEKGFDS